MSLHLTFSADGLGECVARLAPDDAVVILGDAVYAAPLPSAVVHYYLGEDADIRGIQSMSGKRIDYDELVRLCAEHNPVVSWND